ncbi:hypothetical protein QOT17_014906 [Balamuthia mandrillaris]
MSLTEVFQTVDENVLQHVLVWLGPKDLATLCSLSRKWYQAASSNYYWKRIVKRYARELYEEKVKERRGERSRVSSLSSINWKELYALSLLEPMVGEVLEVKDTYGIWSVARVLSKLDRHCFLVYFEGWNELTWTYWLHKEGDADIIRPLTENCPGIGGGGSIDSVQKFQALLQRVHTKLLGQADRTSSWYPPTRTSGHPYPHLYQQGQGNVFQLQIKDVEAWEKLQVQKPFKTCYQLAQELKEEKEKEKACRPNDQTQAANLSKDEGKMGQESQQHMQGGEGVSY